MAVTFDGDNKYIVVTTDTELDLLAIYSDSKEWEDASTEMVHHHVFDVSSELLFTLRYGWKFKPSGYSAGSIIKINGKITTTEGDGTSKTVVATTGSPVTWQFDTPATAVIVATGSTSSGDGMSTGEFIALK
jgi:hypothetical protein